MPLSLNSPTGSTLIALLDRHQDPRTNEDLPGLGFVAKPRCNIGYCADRGIVESAFKANCTECGKSVRNPNAEANVVAKFTPLPNQLLRWPLSYQSPSARLGGPGYLLE